MNCLRLSVLSILCFLVPGMCLAQQTGETWFGVLEVGPQKLRLELKVKKDQDGVYQGAMYSLDQGNLAVPMSRFEIVDGQLEFEVKQVGASFAGKLEGGDPDKQVAVGKFKQGGAAFDMTFKRIAATPGMTLVQTWQGTLVAGPQKFDFQIRMFRDDEGALSAKLDSFSEGLLGLSLELGPKTSVDSEEFNFRIMVTKANYEGRRSEDGQSVEGLWKQSGVEFPLDFKSVPLEETRKRMPDRPQTPKGPFQYESSEHVIRSTRSPGVELGATLTHPRGKGPFPAVILISGSGQQDRDETIFGHKAFFVIADHFANHGIATLRFDDRGKDKSTGDPTTCTSEDFADDVETLVDWLKQQAMIDPEQIILVGHSEGGYIGPMIAARRPDIAALVMLGGTTVPGDQIVLDQSRRIAAAAGASQADLDFQEALSKNAFEMLRNGEAEAPDFVDKLMARTRKEMTVDGQEPEFELPENAAAQLSRFNSPWFRFFLDYDPALALRKIDCPVLALFGEHDLQVHPDLNVPVLEAIWQGGKHPSSECIRFPRLNHLFQESSTGSPAEYAKIDETFNIVPLNKMTEWIQQVTGEKERGGHPD
ncbi:MAG: alpha/beta hydrolase [Planctomycetota bacterium]|nr:alpha/beta hydrolase [Planctomycetota bacterium]